MKTVKFMHLENLAPYGSHLIYCRQREEYTPYDHMYTHTCIGLTYLDRCACRQMGVAWRSVAFETLLQDHPSRSVRDQMCLHTAGPIDSSTIYG